MAYAPTHAPQRPNGRPVFRQAGPWMAAVAALRLCALAALLLAAASLLPAEPIVLKLTLHDTIQPVAEDELREALKAASSQGAAALLVELDTPGGLLTATRSMVGAMLDAPVPVIVYVAPAGARAGSAGFFLLEAADVAAMAPGTNAGAAHPVAEMGKLDETMNEKVTNDAAAFLRSYATRRTPDPSVALEAITASRAWTAEEALADHLIDLTATSDQQLLAAIDGREVVRINGSRLRLGLTGARLVAIRPSMRNLLLGWLVHPDLALLMLLAGALLVYVEFNSPGTVVPGALGTVLLLLSIFALNLLPLRFTAILLLAAAAALLVLEAKFGGHGVLAVAGIAALTFGLLTLVDAPIPEMSVSPWVAFGISAGFGAITVLLLRIALRARHRKTRLGVEALLGKPAVALEPLTPEGHILVEGEIWRARSDVPVASGEELQVMGRNGSELQVATCATNPRPVE